MSASQFPGFVFKEKRLLCQAGNYQFLTPANAETDADLFKHLRKTGSKSLPLQSKHCPVCSDVLCPPRPGGGCAHAVNLAQGSSSWLSPGLQLGSTRGAPEMSSLKERQRHDSHPSGIPCSLHTEQLPCFYSGAPWQDF